MESLTLSEASTIVPAKPTIVPLAPRTSPPRSLAGLVTLHAVPAALPIVPAASPVVAAGLLVVPVKSLGADVTLHRVPLASHDSSTPSQGDTTPFPHASLALQLVTLASTKANIAATSPTITPRDAPRTATDSNGTSHLRTLIPTGLDAASKHFSTGSTPFNLSFHSKEHI